MSKAYASKVIEIALAEVGYLEKASNACLDDKTANVGSNNYTKYARDLDAIGFYNGPKNGFAWCDVFVDWCMVQAFGVSKAKELLNHGPLGAGCPYSAGYYKAAGRWHSSSPQPGDQIFFGISVDKAYHTGLVVKVENGRVYTVEGNTSGVSGVVANGGGVFQKSYSVNDRNICGYGRPNYDIESEEEEMRFEKLKDVTSATYRATLDKLVEKGIIQGKGGSGEDLILDLGEDSIRVLVYLDRQGVFG